MNAPSLNGTSNGRGELSGLYPVNPCGPRVKGFDLQRVHVSQQVLHILRGQYLTVSRHIRTAVADNVGHALVVGRQTGLRKKFILEHTLQSRTFFPPRRIRPVTAVAVVVVDPASSGLLRTEPEFRVLFAPLYITTRECGERKAGNQPSRNHSPRCHSHHSIRLICAQFPTARRNPADLQ